MLGTIYFVFAIICLVWLIYDYAYGEEENE